MDKKEDIKMSSTAALLKSTDNQIYGVLLSQNLRLLYYNSIALKIYGIFPVNVQVFLVNYLLVLLRVEFLHMENSMQVIEGASVQAHMDHNIACSRRG